MYLRRGVGGSKKPRNTYAIHICYLMCHLKLEYQTDLTVFKENTNTPPSTRPIKDTDNAVDKIGTPKTYHTTIQRNPPVKKSSCFKINII